MDTRQFAIIKKDIRSITSNKRMVTVMLTVPLVLTIVLPSIFVVGIVLFPKGNSDFQAIINMLPITAQKGNQEQILLGLVINKIMPIFFLLIPVMASSIMAASSFVGEKEKHTLETLLYSPISLRQLFHSKIFACFAVGMMVSFISLVAMMTVLEIELFVLTGAMILPDISWLIVMLLIAPAISLIAIGIIVRGSAKAETAEEAQQGAVFLILPLIALVIGQFTGIILISPWILLGMGILLAFLASLILKGIAGQFTYERLLR